MEKCEGARELLDQYPNLSSWYDRIATQDSWQHIVQHLSLKTDTNLIYPSPMIPVRGENGTRNPIFDPLATNSIAVNPITTNNVVLLILVGVCYLFCMESNSHRMLRSSRCSVLILSINSGTSFSYCTLMKFSPLLLFNESVVASNSESNGAGQTA